MENIKPENLKQQTDKAKQEQARAKSAEDFQVAQEKLQKIRDYVSEHLDELEEKARIDEAQEKLQEAIDNKDYNEVEKNTEKIKDLFHSLREKGALSETGEINDVLEDETEDSGEKTQESSQENEEKVKEMEDIPPEQAKEIMKENYLGAEAIQETFGFIPENLPNIPFSKEELEKAKELNQKLIFQEDRDNEGNPITMKYIVEKLDNKTSEGNNILKDPEGWQAVENFFRQETPRRGWKLVSQEVLPETLNKNYLEQTEELINHLKDEVFKGEDLPEEYTEAIEDFNRKEAYIASIIESDHKNAGDKIEDLEITKLLRESAPETLYRLVIEEKTHQKSLLESTSSWGFSIDPRSRRFVSIDNLDSDGALVVRGRASRDQSDIGSVFSRMK